MKSAKFDMKSRPRREGIGSRVSGMCSLRGVEKPAKMILDSRTLVE